MSAISKPRAVSPDDITIVEQVRSGDEQAFYLFYKRHARYIAGVAYRILGNDADLDDIVQETFSSAAQNLGQLKNPEQVRLWLVTIAVRLSTRRLKARSRRTLFGLMSNADEAKCLDPGDMETRDELKEALDRLPEKLRVPWILRRVEGMTLGETAEACGISLATVKRRLSAAEAKLRRMIDVD